MKEFKADLHIHTVLSACANLEMSPSKIVGMAKERGIDLIGITDHNSTLHCKLVKELAEEQGLSVLLGVEVTTQEEVHCLAYFEDIKTLELFQDYLDSHLPSIKYKPEKFGYQALVDKDEKIIKMIDGYLNVALNQSIDQVEQEVHRLNGLFVPAHIERPMFGLFNQLGFVPDGLECDAMGIMRHSSENEIRGKFNICEGIPVLKSSDAHSLASVGSGYTCFDVSDLSFGEIKKALKGIEGRKTRTV
jgi:PHP family Zn ribbon phosphoesterase